MGVRLPRRLSVTISGADRLLETPRETLARDIWRDVVRDDGRCGRASGMANRARAARHFRRIAAAGRQASALRRRHGTISCSPAIGRQPGCPRRSKARSDRATARRDLVSEARLRRRDDVTRRRYARARAGPRSRLNGASARRPQALLDVCSGPTGTGCSSSKPTRRSPPNMCCCGIISARRRRDA